MSAKESIPPAYSATEGEVRAGADPGAGTEGSARTDERWLDSLENLLGDVVRKKGPEQVDFLLGQLVTRIRDRQRDAATLTTPYVNTIPREDEPRYPGDRRIERQVKSYVRWNAMAIGGQGQPAPIGHRRPYIHLRVGGEPLRSGLQPLLPGRRRRRAGRPDLFPGACVAGQLRPGLPGAPAERAQAPPLPAGAGQGRRAPLVPPPPSDAGLLAVPLGVHGAAPIMSIYQARFARYLTARGLLAQSRGCGVSWATGKPTSRNPPGRSRWLRGEPRQPDLGGQL